MFAQRRIRTRLSACRRYCLLLCLALAASLAFALPPSGTKASGARQETPPAASFKPRGPAFVPGDVIVRFRGEAKASKAEALAAPLRDTSGVDIPVRFESPEGLEIVSGLRVARVNADDTLRAVAALRARPDVLYAEPNYVRRKLAVPNDARYTEQWNMRGGPPGATAGAHAEGAWDVTTGSRTVVVGVVDEGFDVDHPDLKANVWRNPGEIANNGVDDDGDGYVDDVNGWDFFHEDKTVYDNPSNVSGVDAPDAHGTHVSGIIGAVGNNAQGVAGVNWQVSIMSLKILGQDNESPAPSSVLLTVRAYAYAKRMRDLYASSGGALGANLRVLNNSYGGIGRSQAELDAINELGASGILFVTAAGNDGESSEQSPVYPANYDAPNLINVASSDGSDAVSSFSNFGARSVHMSAPGSSILSTTPNGTYAYASGTSMASPHVAGAAALLCAARPDITVAKLRAALLFGGDAIASQSGKTVTGRRLNVAGSLQLALADDGGAPSITDLRVAAQDGRSVTLAWTAPGDDGAAGAPASLYEIRFVGANAGEQFRLAALRPGLAGSQQSATVKIPYQHQAGTLVLRAFDDAGNAATASVSVGVDDLSANPYTVATGPPSALTTGGTPLHVNFDDSSASYFLPFQFPFFEGYGNIGSQWVAVSSNGAIYFGPMPRNDALSYVERLEGWQMIAGLWDDLDLRTCFRPDADVYVTQETDRVVFRWQGVRFESPACPAAPSGSPVNFEVELRRDGTIVERYGDGNRQVFPVVGIAAGEPSAFVAATHTSEFQPLDLTNAQTVTYTLRRQPARANVGISEYPFNYPYPIRLGDEFDVPVTVKNSGPDRAAGVRLTSTFPKEVAYVSCQTSQGACSAGDGSTVAADLGGLAPGATARAVFTFRTLAVGNGFDINHKVTSTTYDPSTYDNNELTIINIWQGNPTPLTGVAAISAGGGHSLALKPDGTVLAWGNNAAGQLGDGGLSYYAQRPQGVPALTGVAGVAAGSLHNLVVKATGAVWAWGDNSAGQLGDGTNVTRKKPFKVAGLSNVAAVSASYHSLALKSDGTVWAWGANAQGQLGDGTVANRPTPAPVQGLSDVSAIEAGSNFSLALKRDGTVWAWGGNNLGQLGDGTTTLKTSPVQVQGLSGVVAIAAGSAHALALKSDGTVWAWGANNYGQLGDGSNTARTSPAQVVGLTGVASVSCGDYSSTALRSDGTVWSWGFNVYGQLGDGTTTQKSLPVKAVIMKGVLAVSAGGQHVLAMTAGGTVWGWGYNDYGQLGFGTSSRAWAYEATQQRPDAPSIGTVAPPTFSPYGGYFATPQNVGVHVAGDGATVRAVSNGPATTIALTSDGKLYSWGSDQYGQIGFTPVPPGPGQSPSNAPLPREQPVPDAVAVAATAYNHYAVKSDGTVWAWGNNAEGLGTGASGPGVQLTPVQVQGLTNVRAIACGYSHAVALKTDGTVWTWGQNNVGQLGEGTLNTRSSPVQVPGLSGVTEVAAKFNNTYALKSDGTVWAWGDNGFGQTGDGTSGGIRKSPVQVPGLSGVKGIGAAYYCAFAVRSDGTLWAWGTLTNIIRPSPFQIAGLTNVRAAAGGDRFAVALKEDGTVWAWGWNPDGVLGTGSFGSPTAESPQQVAGLSGVASIAVNSSNVLALKSDGGLWAWGGNAFGQLGDGSIAPRAAPGAVETISGNIVVHYTTDGSDPTQDDPAIPAGASVLIDKDMTLKARAFRDGWAPSGVTSAAFAVSGNSIDDTQFYVRQHYRDFLGREPDASGLQFWTNNIDSCRDAQCREVKRIDTSAAFFLSIEFQETGFLVYRMDKAAFGDLAGLPVPVRRAELLSDMQLIGQNVVVGQGDWQAQLEANKRAFALAFVKRQRFADAYPSAMTPADFVAKLNANVGGALGPAQTDALTQELSAAGNSDAGRASVLRKLAESAEVSHRESNAAFVLMQYFGYLRRDPDAAPDSDYSGFQFWLSKLNQFGGDYRAAEMVKAFISSTEYRKRFGP